MFCYSIIYSSDLDTWISLALLLSMYSLKVHVQCISAILIEQTFMLRDTCTCTVRAIKISHYTSSCTCMLHMLYLDVPGTEEKLSVEVARLDDVHVSDVHCSSLTTAHTHHGIVLQELTPDGSCTNLRRGREGVSE